MTISFNQIPNNLRVPFMYTEFDNSNAVSGAQAQPFKVLIIGQKLAAGTKAVHELARLTNAKQAETLFGKGSMLHEMFEAYFTNNSNIEVFGIALADNAAGVASSGSFKFGGAPTVAGTAVFRVFGKKVSIGVAVVDTPGTLATKLIAAITSSVPSAVAVIDGADTTKVNVSYVHKGLVGNFLDLRQGYYEDEKGLPNGLTCAIVSMTGGAGNPEIEDLLAALPQEHYNVVAFPYTDTSSISLLDGFLEERWNALKQIEGLAFSAANLTHSGLGALGDSFNTKNISIMDCHKSISGPHIWAAAISGVVAFEASKDPARPLQYVEVKGVFAEEAQDSFTDSERNLLLFDGISTHKRNANGNVIIEAMITTYKVNATGADDTSYLYVEPIYTLAYLRYDWNAYVGRKYYRHKLASNGTPVAPGQAVMTPNLYKAELINQYKAWMDLGLVEDMDGFKASLVVERDAGNPNRLNALISPDLMNQFRIGANKIAFKL